MEPQTRSDEIKELLNEITAILRVVSVPQIKNSLETEFKEATQEKKLAYELLQSDRSQGKIVEIVKNTISGARISTGGIANWCMTWERLGLARKERSKEKPSGSYVKCFSLREYGINVHEVRIKE